MLDKIIVHITPQNNKSVNVVTSIIFLYQKLAYIIVICVEIVFIYFHVEYFDLVEIFTSMNCYCFKGVFPLVNLVKQIMNCFNQIKNK